MASKRIFRACKLQGLSLHADALARLTEELTKCVCVPYARSLRVLRFVHCVPSVHVAQWTRQMNKTATERHYFCYCCL